MGPPVPVGAPADVAFGMAVMGIGVAALLVMGNGFEAGGGKKKSKGIGLPGAPNARQARDKDGNPTQWPSSKKNDDKDEE